MSIALLFLRIGLLRYDNASILDFVRRVMVDEKNVLTSEQMDVIAACSKMSYGSSKLTVAFLTGHHLGSLLWSAGLMLLVSVPSFVLIGFLYYYVSNYIRPDQLLLAAQGVIPVLAALFAVKAWEFAKLSWQRLPWHQWFFILLLATGLLVVLQWPVVIALLVLSLFFLAFFQGGTLDD